MSGVVYFPQRFLSLFVVFCVSIPLVFTQPADPALAANETQATPHSDSAGTTESVASTDRAASTDGAQKLTLGITTDIKPTKLTYRTGEPIGAIATFSASGASVNIEDATLRLTVPKPPQGTAYWAKPSFVSSKLASSSVESEDQRNWYINYHFDRIVGGTQTSLPFPMKFENNVTPNGTTITPTWELLDKAGNQIIPSVSETFTGTAVSVYRAKGDIYYARGGNIYDFRFPDQPSWSTAIARFLTDDYDTRTQMYSGANVMNFLGVQPVFEEGQDTTTGIYQPRTMRVDVVLPEGTKANLEKNPDWEWQCNEALTQCSITRDFTRYPGYYDWRGPWITFDLTGADIYTNGVGSDLKDHVLKATYTLDPGTPGEQVLTAQTSTKLEPTRYKAYPGNISHSSNRRNFRNIYRYEDEHFWSKERVRHGGGFDFEEDGTNEYAENYWTFTADQNNNGASVAIPRTGGATNVVDMASLYDLDPRVYIDRVKLGVEFRTTNDGSVTPAQAEAAFNQARKTLYGVTRGATEGEETLTPLTSGNPQAGTIIDVRDTSRKYDELRLVFEDPYMMDNISADLMRAWVKPTADEVALWKGKKTYSATQDYWFRSRMKARASSQVCATADCTTADGKPETGKVKVEDVQWSLEPGWALDDNVLHIAPTDGRLGQHSGTGTGTWVQNDDVVVYQGCDPSKLTVQDCARVRKFNVRITPGENGDWSGSNGIVKNLRSVILLPNGVKYLRTTASFIAGVNQTTPLTPTIVDNFNNTGQQALIYSYGDLDYDEIADNWAPQTNGVDFDVDVTLDAAYAPETNDIQYFAVWDNNDSVTPNDHWNASNYVDELDVDQDGNKTEKFLRSVMRIKMFPPLELTTKKQVSIDGKTWGLNSPAQDLGGDVYYRHIMANKDTENSVNVLSLIDVMPNTNDRRIVANQDGDHVGRTWSNNQLTGEHSAFETPLLQYLDETTGVDGTLLNAPINNRFTYYYSTAVQAEDPTTDEAKKADPVLTSIRDSQWMTKEQWKSAGLTPADVKSVKATLNAGAQISPNETLEIYMHSAVAFNDTTKMLANGSRAVNSHAYSTDETRYIEANQVMTETAHYTESGIMFNDFDKDGVFDTNEELLSGRAVELVDEATGQVATDPDGRELKTTTDANGAYSFNVYKRGTYKVRFAKTPKEFFTAAKDGAGTSDTSAALMNVASPAAVSGLSDAAFVLNPSHPSARMNAGVGSETPERTFTIHKTKEDGKTPLQGATFLICADTTCLGQARLASATTDATGTAVFKNVPFSTSDKNPSGKWILRELQAPEGFVVASDEQITVDADSSELATAIKDPFIRGTVTVSKQDAATGAALAGAVFTLTPVTGKSMGTETITATTGVDGKATFNDVLYGTYTLTETTAPTHYTAWNDSKEVTVTKNGDTVDAGTVEDEIFTGMVTVLKTDAETKASLKGAKFGLFANGDAVDAKPVATATSGDDGKAVFTSVRYGDYEIREIEAPTGFLLSSQKLVVTMGTDQNQDGWTFEAGTVEDTPIKGSIVVSKQDAATGAALAGADFALFHSGVASDAEPLATATSGEDGKALFEGVRYGDYEIRETKAPTHYSLSTESLTGIKVRENGKTVDAGTVKDEIFTGTVTVKKTDAATGGVLKGAKFGLFVKQNPDSVATEETNNNEVKPGEPSDQTHTSTSVSDQPLYEATSDEHGLVSFKDVRYGDYELRELKAPDGYELSAEVRSVTMGDEQETNDWSFDAGTFTNTAIPVPPVPQKPRLARTGAQGIGAIMTGSLLLLAGGLALRLRKQSSIQ